MTNIYKQIKIHTLEIFMIKKSLFILFLLSYSITSTAHPFSKMQTWAITSALVITSLSLVLDLGTLIQVGLVLPEMKSLKDIQVNCNQTDLCPQNTSSCAPFERCQTFALAWQNETNSNYKAFFQNALPTSLVCPLTTVGELWIKPIFLFTLIMDSIRLAKLAHIFQTSLEPEEQLFLTRQDADQAQSIRKKNENIFKWSITSLPVHFAVGLGIIYLSYKGLKPLTAKNTDEVHAI